MCICISIVVPNNSDNSSDSGAIVGGVVGGIVLFLMIIIVLCIVILCMRRSHRKKGPHVDNATKLNTYVTIKHNPSYDVTKANTVDFDTINPGIHSHPTVNTPKQEECGVVNQP